MNTTLMTPDEIDIETFRYRAPVVVPLERGRFAVLTPGLGQSYQIVENGDCLSVLHDALTYYIQWNTLPDAKYTPKRPAASVDSLYMLGLSDQEIDAAIEKVIGKKGV